MTVLRHLVLLTGLAGSVLLTCRADAASLELARLLLMCEYARRDLEIQEARARKDAPAGIRRSVEALSGFLQEHGDRGVFLMHSRLTASRLLQSYGVTAPRR